MATKSKVKNLTSHPVFIAPEGRVIPPGEILSGVDLEAGQNKALIDNESLVVVEKDTDNTEKGGNK